MLRKVLHQSTRGRILAIRRLLCFGGPHVLHLWGEDSKAACDLHAKAQPIYLQMLDICVPLQTICSLGWQQRQKQRPGSL